jgi:outer membrane protein
MKWTLSIALNIVLVIAVAILFYLHFHHEAARPDMHPAVDSTSAPQFAYVNMDTLQAHYTYFKEKRAQLEAQQARMEKELQQDAQQLQREYNQFQQKAPTMTQAEGEAAQQKLLQHQQQLQAKQEAMRQQLLAQQQAFQDSLQHELHAFLQRYNADKHYQFIFSYASGASDILLANPAQDITRDVIEGLNALHAAR